MRVSDLLRKCQECLDDFGDVPITIGLDNFVIDDEIQLIPIKDILYDKDGLTVYDF